MPIPVPRRTFRRYAAPFLPVALAAGAVGLGGCELPERIEPATREAVPPAAVPAPVPALAKPVAKVAAPTAGKSAGTPAVAQPASARPRWLDAAMTAADTHPGAGAPVVPVTQAANVPAVDGAAKRSAPTPPAAAAPVVAKTSTAPVTATPAAVEKPVVVATTPASANTALPATASPPRNETAAADAASPPAVTKATTSLAVTARPPAGDPVIQIATPAYFASRPAPPSASATGAPPLPGLPAKSPTTATVPSAAATTAAVTPAPTVAAASAALPPKTETVEIRSTAKAEPAGESRATKTREIAGEAAARPAVEAPAATPTARTASVAAAATPAIGTPAGTPAEPKTAPSPAPIAASPAPPSTDAVTDARATTPTPSPSADRTAEPVPAASTVATTAPAISLTQPSPQPPAEKPATPSLPVAEAPPTVAPPSRAPVTVVTIPAEPVPTVVAPTLVTREPPAASTPVAAPAYDPRYAAGLPLPNLPSLRPQPTADDADGREPVELAQATPESSVRGSTATSAEPAPAGGADAELRHAADRIGLSELQLARIEESRRLIGEGNTALALELMQQLNAELDVASVYTVSAGDEALSRIAAKPEIYGNAYLWPLIWRDNLDRLKQPDRLARGQKLRIPAHPSLTDVSAALDYARRYERDPRTLESPPPAGP